MALQYYFAYYIAVSSLVFCTTGWSIQRVGLRTMISDGLHPIPSSFFSVIIFLLFFFSLFRPSGPIWF